MKELEKIKILTPVLLLQLSGDKWTVELLATADPKQLIKYQGVGHVTAKRIIAAAQEVVNEAGLEEATFLDNIPPDVRDDFTEEVQASARVRRAKESAQ